jgi:hypothetical protein
MSEYNITFSIYLHWLSSEEREWLEGKILEGWEIGGES